MQKIFAVAVLLLVMAGCGDSGGGAGVVKVTLSTPLGSLPAGKSLAAVGVTLQLASGVTPALAANGTVASGVVKGSGVLAADYQLYYPSDPPAYIPATSTTPGTLTFIIYSTSSNGGFGNGEFASLTLNKAKNFLNFSTVSQDMISGTALPTTVSADFKVVSYSAVDLATSSVLDNISVILHQ